MVSAKRPGSVSMSRLLRVADSFGVNIERERDGGTCHIARINI